jgi:hypothetical protein
MTTSIALVLDQDFGDRLDDLSSQMPVWIVPSEANDLPIKRLRQDLRRSITTLLTQKNESADEILWRSLADIEEHHGPFSTEHPYDTVYILGADDFALTPKAMRDLGLVGLKRVAGGYSVSKVRAPSEEADLK